MSEDSGVIEHRLAVVEQEVAELREKQSRDNKEFFERIQGLEREYAVLKADVGHIRETVDEMHANLKILMAAPGKRYETIIACVITTVVGTIIGLIISGALP
jgi:uncharacterized coiled-coil DUF342 family protein